MKLADPILRLSRSLTARTIVIGVALTLMVMALDAAGGLHPIERYGYDKRASVCQHFTSPPSNRIVHVDMDDAALETIGRWPWGRSKIADIVDEVRRAGADALSLDLIFPEPQSVEYVPVVAPFTAPAAQAEQVGLGPTTNAAPIRFEVVDHDALLAEAIRRFGRVMVGVSFDTEPAAPSPPVRKLAVEVLTSDLELTREEVMAKLPDGGGPAFTADQYFLARRDALSRRIESELARGVVPADVLRPRLLPRMGARADTSSLARQYLEVYREVTALNSIGRFAHEVPPNCPPLLRPARPIALPISAFADAAWVSGYVDYMPVDLSYGDGMLRSVPLAMNFGGRLYPQMDLAVVCAVLGSDVRDVKIGPREIVIPARDGRELIVPVNSVRTDKYGVVGAVFDIPWFGTSDWATMYDYPSHKAPLQHVPATELWGLAESRRRIARNYREALVSLELLAAVGSKPAEAFVAKPISVDDVNGWAAAFDLALKDVAPALESIRKDPPEKRSVDDQQALAAFDRVETAAVEGRKVVTKEAAIRARLAGKVVLFGGTATSLGDVKATSLHPECPGVVVHGVVINAMLTGHFWRQAPAWVTGAITLAMGLLVTAVVAYMSPIAAAATTFLLACVYAVVNGAVVFDQYDLIVGLAGPTVVAALVWGTLTLFRYFAESLERARITRRFQRYVDPALVNFLIANPDITSLEGEVREMTVVFTDLAGYTTLTEKLRERAVKILGRYKTVMVPAIRRHRGFIHSFMGDGIMFSYGAPQPNSNHAIDALSTILDVQDVMKSFNAELAAQNLGPLVTRVGVCTGPVVVGDSGSEEGSDYACLGNTTNLAARLESANKAVGTTMMISERTAELLEGRFLLRPIAKLTVKGKTVPEMTFEPLAPADAATDEQRRLVALTTAVFDAYVAGRFADCVAAADAMDAEVGPSKLTALYRDTCREYLAAGGPPADFLGQIVLKEK